MEKIDNDDSLISKDEKDIMGNMAQEYHFSSIPNSEGIGVNELRQVFDYTAETIRNNLRKLNERGLIEKVKGRPVGYIISRDYLENET